MERILIGVTRKDKVTNQNLWKKTDVQDIIKEIKIKNDDGQAIIIARQRDNRWTQRVADLRAVFNSSAQLLDVS